MQISAEKILCLSGKEFAVLANVSGIRELLCFKSADESDMPAVPDEREYHLMIHDMVKRGILEHNDENIVVSPDVADIFTCIHSADLVVQINRNPDNNKPSVCIYVKKEKGFVSALPGSRKGEYIRLCYHNISDLSAYIKDTAMADADSVFSGIKDIVVNNGSGDRTEFSASLLQDGRLSYSGTDGKVYDHKEVSDIIVNKTGGNI